MEKVGFGNSRVIFLFKPSVAFVGLFGIISDQVREAWGFFDIGCVDRDGDSGLGISLQNALLWPSSLSCFQLVNIFGSGLWVFWNSTWSHRSPIVYMSFWKKRANSYGVLNMSQDLFKMLWMNCTSNFFFMAPCYRSAYAL